MLSVLAFSSGVFHDIWWNFTWYTKLYRLGCLFHYFTSSKHGTLPAFGRFSGWAAISSSRLWKMRILFSTWPRVNANVARCGEVWRSDVVSATGLCCETKITLHLWRVLQRLCSIRFQRATCRKSAKARKDDDQSATQRLLALHAPCTPGLGSKIQQPAIRLKIQQHPAATIMPKKENLKLHHVRYVSILESSDCSWTSFDSSRRKCVPSLRLSQQKAQCCASRRVGDFGLHCLHQLQWDCCCPSLTKCSVAVHFNADSSAVAWPMNANQHIPRTKLWGKGSLLIAKRRVFTWNFGQCQQSHKHHQDPQTVTYCDHERHTCGYLWQLVPLLLLPLFLSGGWSGKVVNSVLGTNQVAAVVTRYQKDPKGIQGYRTHLRLPYDTNLFRLVPNKFR